MTHKMRPESPSVFGHIINESCESELNYYFDFDWSRFLPLTYIITSNFLTHKLQQVASGDPDLETIGEPSEGPYTVHAHSLKFLKLAWELTSSPH
ncbi:unnamed protein product [Pieris brassicae]|uniref:Uncharacterized protein n=1 Tax=Pieris brassicae TaxID=7116 RepID=A0A9P0TGA3_PIEBR|nr:unnamed protein product [Pieris brassicae]